VKMQKIVDQGGYQYGDKVTILYESATSKAVKVKANLRSHLIRGAAACFACLGCRTLLPSDPAELTALIRKYSSTDPGQPRIPARACLVPHAGYFYSGHVGGAVLARIALPRKIIILGVRHYPRGEAAAILSSGAWRTPLGDARIDEVLAEGLKRSLPVVARG